MPRKNILFTLLLISIFLFVSCTTKEYEFVADSPATGQETSETQKPATLDIVALMSGQTPDEDVVSDSISNTRMKAMRTGKYAFKAELKDVAGGEASGVARANYDGEYELWVSFEDLPTPETDYYYEGWIVRSDPLHIISTGKVRRNSSGNYEDGFINEEDLTDHDIYVLTLENGDDPTPGKHIVEGLFVSVPEDEQQVLGASDEDDLSGEETTADVPAKETEGTDSGDEEEVSEDGSDKGPPDNGNNGKGPDKDKKDDE